MYTRDDDDARQVIQRGPLCGPGARPVVVDREGVDPSGVPPDPLHGEPPRTSKRYTIAFTAACQRWSEGWGWARGVYARTCSGRRGAAPCWCPAAHTPVMKGAHAFSINSHGGQTCMIHRHAWTKMWAKAPPRRSPARRSRCRAACACT